MSVDVEHRNAPSDMAIVECRIAVRLEARFHMDRVAARNVIRDSDILGRALSKGSIEEVINIDMSEGCNVQVT